LKTQPDILPDWETDSMEITAILEKARGLTAELEQGHDVKANQLLDELTHMRESALFGELGQLTRQLHQALGNLHTDSRLAGMALDEVPDARSRLEYVIEKTDEAAHLTLGAVEKSSPLASRLAAQAAALGTRCRQFRQDEPGGALERNLEAELLEFLDLAAADGASVGVHLEEIMMAQGFQDLTGQVIRRVMEVVQEVEDNLVSLIRVRANGKASTAIETAHRDALQAEGPILDVETRRDAVSNQDEVDDLLSNLGF
jgi:chemotaxis protein CheZ